jgi:hypothetical protein
VSLAAAVAWAMFALLIGWVGAVLWATVRQLDDEGREAGKRRP